MEKIKTALIWIICLLFALSVGIQCQAQQKKYELVKIDKVNRRAFIVIPRQIMEKRSELCAAVLRIRTELRDKASDTEMWAISLFDRQEYANYKDEIPTGKITEWKKSYLGEIDSQNVLWTFPAVPEKKIKYDLRDCLKGK